MNATLVVAIVVSAIVLVMVIVVAVVIARIARGVTAPGVQFIQLAPMQMPMAVPLPPPAQALATNQIKKVVCKECGGQKVQPPKTACIYCDYCGALVDWDFQMTVARGWHVQPFRVLAELTVPEQPIRDHAIRIGDKAALRDSMVRTMARHMEICPETHPPRIADPAYRKALLEWVAASDVDAFWDPEFRVRDAAVKQIQTTLQYYPRPGQLQGVYVESFRPLVAARKHSLARQLELAEPTLPLHPDRPSLEVYAAISASMFIQSWMHRLQPHEQEWFIREMGQTNEYIPIPAAPTVERHCGTCGGHLAVLPGARRVLCTGCGRYNDVARGEIPCGGCGAPVSIPSETRHFACPYCRAAMHA